MLRIVEYTHPQSQTNTNKDIDTLATTFNNLLNDFKHIGQLYNDLNNNCIQQGFEVIDGPDVNDICYMKFSFGYTPQGKVTQAYKDIVSHITGDSFDKVFKEDIDEFYVGTVDDDIYYYSFNQSYFDFRTLRRLARMVDAPLDKVYNAIPPQSCDSFEPPVTKQGIYVAPSDKNDEEFANKLFEENEHLIALKKELMSQLDMLLRLIEGYFAECERLYDKYGSSAE